MTEAGIENQLNEISELYDGMEKRMQLNYAKANAKPSFWSLVFGKRTKPDINFWQREKQEVLSVIRRNDVEQLAALLNLHALNSAIEAARSDDRILAQYAETLRNLAEQTRKLIE